MTRMPLFPIEEDPQTPLKTAIAPHVLTVIWSHHVRVTENYLSDEALLVFLQRHAKTSLERDDYYLTSLGGEMEYQMNLKPFDRVESVAFQCERIIQTYGLHQIVESKAEKKKWRQVIVSKIKPKLFSGRLGEALTNSLDTEIRDNYVKFFECLKGQISSIPLRVRFVQADKGFQ